MSKPITTYTQALCQDSLVHQCSKNPDLIYGDTIAIMAERHRQLTERLMELEMIAPRKIKVGDSWMIYHTPDHLIPLGNTGL